MNKKELVNAILKEKGYSNVTRRHADTFITSLTNIIKRTVKKGEDVSLVGFGTFTRVRRQARWGYNPSTGQKIKIKARTLPKFRPGKTWKDCF
jgi:DNA-binding protein HU-beta